MARTVSQSAGILACLCQVSCCRNAPSPSPWTSALACLAGHAMNTPPRSSVSPATAEGAIPNRASGDMGTWRQVQRTLSIARASATQRCRLPIDPSTASQEQSAPPLPNRDLRPATLDHAQRLTTPASRPIARRRLVASVAAQRLVAARTAAVAGCRRADRARQDATAPAATTLAPRRSTRAKESVKHARRLVGRFLFATAAPPAAPSPNTTTTRPPRRPGGRRLWRCSIAHQQSGLATLTTPAPDAPTLYQRTQPISDDTHDNDPPAFEPYISSLQQRQQQAAEFFRAQHNYSRASSSEGSAAHTLRRTPNIEDVRQRYRTPPADPAPEPQQRTVRFAAEYSHLSPGPSDSFRARISDPQFEPHPALRISQRTASAIHFVLEEAIRTPYPFTPDLAEENASMAELTAGGNGRAANAGARAGGPFPVTKEDRPNIVTPQMIMNNRRQREARREAEEERKAQEAREERRRSAERRAQAAGVAGAPMNPDAGIQRQPQPQQTYDSGYGSYGPQGASARQPAPPAAATLPPSGRAQDTTSGAQSNRPRANSQSQQQPRPVQQPSTTQAGSSRRPPPAQHARNPSAPAASAQPVSSAPAAASALPGASSSSQQRQSTVSTFPHAFERWETLSSHWEGLTSYWIRRLEQNTDEVRGAPLAQQMSRQITDLSAAGANLFHAVVELQRLRASSERKFQRWFYDHRQEQERAQEREAQLENTIRDERAARNQAVADMERLSTEKRNAERSVQEMKRELQISKEEARRAWEELGRREQEERDRVFSLREGQPTMIGGVQVLPTAQAMGRHGSVRSHGDDTYGASSASQGIEQHYSYEEGQSPTDTDPFTEGRRHEPEAKPVAQGTYVPSGAGPSTLYQPGYSQAPEQPQIPAPLRPQQASSGHQGPPAPQQPFSKDPRTSQPEAFYQQPDVYLHRDSAASPEDERSTILSHPEEDPSDAEDEYAIDENGNYILDAAGHRVPFRALRQQQQQDSDDEDVSEDRRRELEHLHRYGSTATTVYGSTATMGTGSGVSQAPADYSGDGYGSEWVGMRHHHPTRLSDVMEEDERSRTSPSRASQASRGWLRD
ncbi:uncharacterized protein CC84DRAFT_1203021 [Paraphaeosphaeria sporulosa]|uniref:Uncharacterized protein n=1 Tax=Paraphaeosphaeria sporulosa TaxID=1460663 RepID=A0A177CUM6_9PLEO|nr:uncharacterized protein CC84DRAFT_1203021 [Paraphaeosphaeria sporulosa]OAG10612.1 hypothetical protein CC84DRAFT_1203021 [Paraphaeosphaeria sporulosa]